MNKWAKTTLVAAVGGAVPALSVAMMDPAKFGINVQDGINLAELERLVWIAVQGAAVAVGALYLHPPKAQQEQEPTPVAK